MSVCRGQKASSASDAGTGERRLARIEYKFLQRSREI